MSSIWAGASCDLWPWLSPPHVPKRSRSVAAQALWCGELRHPTPTDANTRNAPPVLTLTVALLVRYGPP